MRSARRELQGTRETTVYWDRDGFAVWAKRLERGTFRIPAAADGRVEMSAADLAALLAGIDLGTARCRVRYARPVTPEPKSEQRMTTNPPAPT